MLVSLNGLKSLVLSSFLFKFSLFKLFLCCHKSSANLRLFFPVFKYIPINLIVVFIQSKSIDRYFYVLRVLIIFESSLKSLFPKLSVFIKLFRFPSYFKALFSAFLILAYWWKFWRNIIKSCRFKSISRWLTCCAWLLLVLQRV